jgi:hypothetical protein
MSKKDTVKITWKAFGDKPEDGKFVTSVEFKLLPVVSKFVTAEQICEQVYKQTNLRNGPIWDVIVSELSPFRTHTAISVGDEIEVEGQVYICADFGFEKIEDVEIKKFGDAIFSVEVKEKVK